MVNEAYVELWSVIDGTPLQILGKILSDVYVLATSKTMFKHKDDNGNDDDHGEESEDNEEEAKDKEPVLIQKIKCEPSASTSKSTPKENKTQSKTPQGQKQTPRPSQGQKQTPRPPRQKSDTKTPPKAKIKGFQSQRSDQEGGSRGSFRTYEILRCRRGLPLCLPIWLS